MCDLAEIRGGFYVRYLFYAAVLIWKLRQQVRSQGPSSNFASISRRNPLRFNATRTVEEWT